MADFTIPFEHDNNRTLTYDEAIACYEKLAAACPRQFRLNSVGSTDSGRPLHVAVISGDGEFDPEVRCAALPVRDFSGQVIGAIGISGPVWRLSIEALQKRARRMRVAADRLSVEFGYAGEPEARMKAAI